MLTKEEARELIYKLISRSCFVSEYAQIQAAVDEYTEKPKIKLRVGEIYYDRLGGYAVCINHREEVCKNNPNNSCTEIRFLKTDAVQFLRHDGSYLRKGGIVFNTLDLSKCYKLVEVENVD